MRIKFLLTSILAGVGLTACASNVSQLESLSNYERLQDAERGLMPVREYADAGAMAGVTSIYLERARVAAGLAESAGVDEERLDRVAGVLSRTLCRRLARGGFEVRTEPDGASHAMVVTVTGFDATNPVTAGASSVIGAFVPGPLNPRLPLGIGALAAEGELLDENEEQIAAMQWDARNHLVSGGGTLTLLRGDIGSTSDAEDLAQSFADAFGDLLVNARDDAGGERGETPRGTCPQYFEDLEDDEELSDDAPPASPAED